VQRMPAWLPIAAGLAVVAVATLAVVLAAGGGSKSVTTTTGPEAASTSTTQATTTTAESTTTTSTTIAGPEAGGSWTVLVYGLGDNNLEADLLGDLEEMAAVPPAALTFVALADRTPDYTDQALPGIGDWDTAKLLAITPGTFTEEADLGELNMGDPVVLADFIQRGVAGHPADHYALILWDHGSIAGVGSDESSGDGLTVPEIAKGVRDGLTAAGVDRLDIIGFDACLMAAYEVAASMGPLADYMVASEEVEPNDGWDYAAFDLIAAQPDLVTALSLGEEIVARYVATSGADDPTVTMSLLDLSHVGALVTALDGLNGQVAPTMATFASAIGRGRSQAPSFGSSPVPEEDFYMVDLGAMLQNLSEADAPLGGAATTALAALQEVVVASQAGDAAAAATGLTVHFPPYGEYYYPDWYRATEAPVWPDFLEAYYTAGTEIPVDKRPSFAQVANQASHYFDEYGLNVEGIFDQGAVENIVDAILYTGVVADDGTITYIGEDQGLYEGNQAVASNDLTRLRLDDGQDQAFAYQDISFSEDLNIFMLDVPLAYYPPGSAPGSGDYRDVTLKLTYDATTEDFTEGFYVTDEFGTIGEFQADPTGLIVPWMLEWRTDGTSEWVQTSDVGLWADLPNLLYDFPTLAPGTHIYAELYVYDYGGNSDYASVDTVIPTGEAAWASCANDTWGFQVSYPGEWFAWEAPTPDLDCAYFDPSSMEGLTADEAFAQAALTVEVYEGSNLEDTVAFLTSQSVVVEDAEVAGLAATRYESVAGEFGFRAYVVPLGTDPGGPTLVLAAWGSVDESLTSLADRVAASLLIAG
jgi:hypothetical protein